MQAQRAPQACEEETSVRPVRPTPALEAAVAAYEAVAAVYVPGQDSASVLELAKLALADALLAAIGAQTTTGRRARPATAPMLRAALVDLGLRRKA